MKILKSDYWKEGSTTTTQLWGSDAVFFKPSPQKFNPFLIKELVKYSELVTVITVNKDNITSILSRTNWPNDSESILTSIDIARLKKDEFATYIELENDRKAIVIANQLEVTKMLKALEDKKAGKSKKIIISGELIVVIAIICAVPYFMLKQSSPKTPIQYSERDKEVIFVERSKRAVKSILKDPNSAEFKDVYFSKKSNVACGKVNSKNGFGGYVGFKRFISGTTPDLTFIEDQVKDFYILWNKMC
jgi:hypothetical protein